jgi:hypothetical protein
MGQGISRIWECGESDTHVNNTREGNDNTQRRNQFNVIQNHLENSVQQQSDINTPLTRHSSRDYNGPTKLDRLIRNRTAR